MLEQLEVLNNIIVRTNEKLHTIVDLLNKGEMKTTHCSLLASDSVEIKTVFENHATISVGLYKYKGSQMIRHKHNNIEEYLICLYGTFNIQYNNMNNILNYKECILIPRNTLHTVIALEDNAELAAVCVPSEEGFKRRYYE